MPRKTAPRAISESGQAAFVGLAIALVALAAFALPAYEAARAINDRVLAASAAEDAAAAVAANPAMTKPEIESLLNAAYPQIAGSMAVSATVSPPIVTPYFHHLGANGTGYRTRLSKTARRYATVVVEASNGYATSAGALLEAATGKHGYAVSATATAVVDETVSNGRW